MQEYGVIVDSTAKHHAIDYKGNYGKQMISPSPDVCLPLDIRSALMTMRIRKPSEEELSTMKFHTLTSNEQWIPKNYNDPDYSINNTLMNHCDLGEIQYMLSFHGDL